MISDNQKISFKSQNQSEKKNSISSDLPSQAMKKTKNI
jgi:hypothetical protein